MLLPKHVRATLQKYSKFPHWWAVEPSESCYITLRLAGRNRFVIAQELKQAIKYHRSWSIAGLHNYRPGKLVVVFFSKNAALKSGTPCLH